MFRLGFAAILSILAHISTAPAQNRADIPVPDGTDLSRIAASMKVGEWRQVATSNINATLSAQGSSGTVFGFTDNIKWDPSSRRLFYVGGDHGDKTWFVVYDERTNSWRRVSERKWGHGYDHNALDPVGGAFFYLPVNSPVVERYDIQTAIWSSLPSLKNQVEYINCCVGIEYFPELRGLVYVARENKGTVLLWEQRSNLWRRLGDGFPIGKYHNFAEYNPVHRMMLFGGGNPPHSKTIHRIDRTGEITRLGDAPVPLGIQQSIVTVDPVSGEFLVFTNRSEFYAYDVTADRWRRIETSIPMWSYYKNPIHGVVATPISNYGVNLFVTCKKPRSCFVYLYRHSEPKKSAN